MDYELAKKLKDAGFPQENRTYYFTKCCSEFDSDEWDIVNSEFHDEKTGEWGDCHELKDQESYAVPTLEELIEACGDYFVLHSPGSLDVNEEWYQHVKDVWTAYKQFPETHKQTISSTGLTPEEAVANLWLELNK